MGPAKSRARHSSFDEEVENHSETNKTCCWTGIRKFFSKSKRPKPMALQMVEDDVDSDDDNDDDNVIDSSKSSAASIQPATVSEPGALHRSWSAPAVLGEDCHHTLMPAMNSNIEDELASTSYPKDVRVSAQCFLSYHRFINDEENESISSDIEQGNEDVGDADVESNADDDMSPVPGLVYSESEYTNDDFTVDKETEDEVKNAIDECSEDETSSQTDQTVMVKEYVSITNVTVKDDKDENTCIIYPSCSSKGSDVTSDDDATSQVEDMKVLVAAISVIFLIRDFIHTAVYGVYQTGLGFIHEIVMGNEDEMDVDEEEAVIVSEESGDRTLPGHPEKYLDFIFDIWANIYNACGSVYQAGLQFVQDIVIGEEDDGMDVDDGWSVVGTEEAEDRIPSGCPKRQSDSTISLWAVINNISSSVSQFLYDIMKEEGEDEEGEEEEEKEVKEEE